MAWSLLILVFIIFVDLLTRKFACCLLHKLRINPINNIIIWQAKRSGLWDKPFGAHFKRPPLNLRLHLPLYVVRRLSHQTTKSPVTWTNHRCMQIAHMHFSCLFSSLFFCWFMPKLKYWLCALNFRAGKFELPIKKRDEGCKVEAKFLAKQYAT